MRWLFFLVVCYAFNATAQAADWRQASSEHYVVYAKLEDSDLRALVQRMEDFHRLLEVTLAPQNAPRRRAHIYLEQSAGKISEKLRGDISGFAGSLPEMAFSYSQYRPGQDPQVRYYALHYAQTQLFLTNGFYRTNSVWVRDGVPAFFKTVQIGEDGEFLLGAPDARFDKRGELSPGFIEGMLSLERLPAHHAARLTYYLMAKQLAWVLLMNPENTPRLHRYFDAYNSGLPPAQAGDALGGLEPLRLAINALRTADEEELAQALRPIALPERPAKIETREMRPDEIDLIELRIERLVGTRIERTAKRLKRLADRHPNSADVWYEYAAAEFTRVRRSAPGGDVLRGFGFSAGQITVVANPYSDRVALAAVRQALKLDPDHAAANVLLAEIQLRRLVESDDGIEAADFDAVREALRPMAIEPELYPLAAAVMFQSRIEEGVTPLPEELELLGRAFRANPAVRELRYAYAVAMARQGKGEEARVLLSSMLNDPVYREAAQRALAEMPGQ